MLLGSSSSSSRHSQGKLLPTSAAESVIPEEQLQGLLEEIEDTLQRTGLQEQGMLLTVGAWHIMVARKPEIKESTELELNQLDYYVVDYRQVLGEGSQGKVVLAQNILTRQLAAVKMQIPNGPAFDEDLIKERRNLARCNRLLACAKRQASDTPTSIVSSTSSSRSRSLSGSSSDKNDELTMKATTYYTLMTYYPGQNLLDFLYEYDHTQPKDSPAYFASKKTIEITSIARMAIYALNELVELHDAGLMHRDIKSSNFVANKAGLFQDCVALKLIDLGTALLIDAEFSRDDASSLGYVPNEFQVDAKDRPYWTPACDAFQFGIVLAELLTSYNYQAGLNKFSQEQERLNDKRHLTFEEIQALMPDVIIKPSKKRDSKTKHSKKASHEPLTEQAVKDQLATYLKELIAKLTLMHPEPAKRPDLSDLKTCLQNLRSELLRVETILQTQFAPERFAAFKLRRKNTASAPIPTSIPIAIADQTSAPASEPLSRRKSQATFPSDEIRSGSSSSSAESIQIKPLSIPHLEELSMKDGRVVSPRKPKISLAAPGKLTEVFSKLTLAEQPSEDALIAQLQQTLNNLALLGERANTRGVAGAPMDNFLVYSFLTKSLQGIIEEPKGAEQEKKLSALQRVVDKYHPTRNKPLDQEVENIKSMLHRYTRYL